MYIVKDFTPQEQTSPSYDYEPPTHTLGVTVSTPANIWVATYVVWTEYYESCCVHVMHVSTLYFLHLVKSPYLSACVQ